MANCRCMSWPPDCLGLAACIGPPRQIDLDCYGSAIRAGDGVLFDGLAPEVVEPESDSPLLAAKHAFTKRGQGSWLEVSDGRACSPGCGPALGISADALWERFEVCRSRMSGFITHGPPTASPLLPVGPDYAYLSVGMSMSRMAWRVGQTPRIAGATRSPAPGALRGREIGPDRRLRCNRAVGWHSGDGSEISPVNRPTFSLGPVEPIRL